MKMTAQKKLTTAAGAPVVDNQNIMVDIFAKLCLQ